MAKNAVAFEVSNSGHLDVRKPGAFFFMLAPTGLDNAAEGERIGITHACPCGCGWLSCLWFRGKGPVGRDQWDVKGEWPNVTLSPSIGIKHEGTGYHWHGYLENGEFIER